MPPLVKARGFGMTTGCGLTRRSCTSITAMVPFIIVPLKKKGLVWQGMLYMSHLLA